MQAILANRIAPGLIDKYLATAGYKGQLSDEALSPNAPANLFEPVPGNYAAHGRFDRRSRSGSWEMFTDRHRTAFWAAAGLGLAAVVHQIAKRLDTSPDDHLVGFHHHGAAASVQATIYHALLSARPRRMSKPIEDYALIGDGETAALVSRDGSIDWLCWPRFDSDACFAALLGTKENGHWSIAPTAAIKSNHRRYQNDTLVTETEFETENGTVRLIDFMPMRDGRASSLVRIVEGVSGMVRMRLDLRMRFDYGALPPWSTPSGNGFVARLGPDLIVLHAPVPVSAHAHVADVTFEVKSGDRFAFVLRHSPSPGPVPEAIDAEQALTQTRSGWHDWIKHFDTAKTDWPDVVKRSLITLRAMIYRPSGSLVAAPTTSLPEAPGGTMNWDYRYCWLRDSTFTVGALLNAGYNEEAGQWRDWLLRAIAGSPERIRIMYRIDGARHLTEWTVPTLPGYRFSSPVRIGNAASTQHQIDVFGEVLDCLHLSRLGGIEPDGRELPVILAIVDHLEKVWNTEGSGVWESRAEPRQYTYSKVMAWVGVDRVIKMLRQEHPDAMASRSGACRRYGKRSTTKSAAKVGTRASVPSPSISAARRLMRASSCCPWSVSCQPMTIASRQPST